MRRLLEYTATGDTVVVWRVDRLGRSLIDVLDTVTLLRERGTGIRSVQDGIDPAASSGRLMLNMLATLGEYQRSCDHRTGQRRCHGRESVWDPVRSTIRGSGRDRGEARDRERCTRQGPQRHRCRPPGGVVTGHVLPTPADRGEACLVR